MIKMVNGKVVEMTEEEILEFETQSNIGLEEIKAKEILDQELLIKQEKSDAINNIATLSDQLNLIASVLDTITSENPDQELINNAKLKFAEIKTILSK